jgi:hypothetical protein
LFQHFWAEVFLHILNVVFTEIVIAAAAAVVVAVAVVMDNHP